MKILFFLTLSTSVNDYCAFVYFKNISGICEYVSNPYYHSSSRMYRMYVSCRSTRLFCLLAIKDTLFTMLMNVCALYNTAHCFPDMCV